MIDIYRKAELSKVRELTDKILERNILFGLVFFFAYLTISDVYLLHSIEHKTGFIFLSMLFVLITIFRADSYHRQITKKLKDNRFNAIKINAFKHSKNRYKLVSYLKGEYQGERMQTAMISQQIKQIKSLSKTLTTVILIVFFPAAVFVFKLQAFQSLMFVLLCIVPVVLTTVVFVKRERDRLDQVEKLFDEIMNY